jgi:hypothetical protein
MMMPFRKLPVIQNLTNSRVFSFVTSYGCFGKSTAGFREKKL